MVGKARYYEDAFSFSFFYVLEDDFCFVFLAIAVYPRYGAPKLMQFIDDLRGRFKPRGAAILRVNVHSIE
ncbi:hypothetical protein WK68_20195 [Burkholderia ubonensis]|nr:hypothetical protein WK68_20195 [Burkholderia ubonensis]